MQITVFGASGKVGSLVVESALRRGYTVVAFVHRTNLFSPSGELIVVRGDVYNKNDVASALRGSDAVISCLGSWGTPKKDVLTVAMRAIIPAMEASGMPRIITLTGSGAKAPGEHETSSHRLVMVLVKPFPAHKVFLDGERHMELLAASGLSWTTVRSPVMTSFGREGYRLDLKTQSPLATAHRTAVANALLDQLDSTEFLCHAPFIHRR